MKHAVGNSQGNRKIVRNGKSSSKKYIVNDWKLLEGNPGAMVLETRISKPVTLDLVVNREYYMPKHGYEFYLRVLLDISLVRLAHS